MKGNGHLPIAVIGAGPVGMAAAARLAQRGMPLVILERGPSPGHSVAAWGRVRVFTPWSMNVDEAARTLLEQTGWRMPEPDALPSGAELVRDYLEPLSRHPDIAPFLRTNAHVIKVTRRRGNGIDKDSAEPFVVRWTDASGTASELRAEGVIDASGTWFSPNSMGVDGCPVRGETQAAAAARIAYGIPDVAGAERDVYGNSATLVVGSGHSAMNVILDLLRLRREAPGTAVRWALRRAVLSRDLDNPLNAQLSARRALDSAAMEAARSRAVEVLAPFAADSVELVDGHLKVAGWLAGRSHELVVGRIVVATGFRPDHQMLQGLALDLDDELEAPQALAPIIDPGMHSCETVPAHGAAELAHPEPGLYVVGSKSYGRAPNFLLANGYEQVRSVVAALAGDDEAARVDPSAVSRATGACCRPAREPAAACTPPQRQSFC